MSKNATNVELRGAEIVEVRLADRVGPHELIHRIAPLDLRRLIRGEKAAVERDESVGRMLDGELQRAVGRKREQRSEWRAAIGRVQAVDVDAVDARAHRDLIARRSDAEIGAPTIEAGARADELDVELRRVDRGPLLDQRRFEAIRDVADDKIGYAIERARFDGLSIERVDDVVAVALVRDAAVRQRINVAVGGGADDVTRFARRAIG